MARRTDSHRRARSAWMARCVIVLTAAASAALVASCGSNGPAHAGRDPTVVSLTFDDGWASQMIAAAALAGDGLTGTFYINSGRIGQPSFLTWSQVAGIDAAGNEIGGHTVNHPDLTSLSASQARWEICHDRANITAHGFVDVSFAYPFGSFDSNTGSGNLHVAPIVKRCGYRSGRGAAGLHNITATSDTRPYATTIPPRNPFEIPVSCCINHLSFGGSTPTATALERYVLDARRDGGGWVVFFFHRLCDNCGGDFPAAATSPAQFKAFADWLRAHRITVRTVGQVISGDTAPPRTTISCGGVTCSRRRYHAPVRVTLSATDPQDGLAAIRYTTNGSDPTVSSRTYMRPVMLSATTTIKYRSWDRNGNVAPTKTQPIRVEVRHR